MSNVDLDKILNYSNEYQGYLKNIKKSGNELLSLCPFHHEKNQSFCVDLSTGKYKCFSCGASGNYINFISKIKSISTNEAYKEILKNNGINDIEQEKFDIFKYGKNKKLDTDYLKKEWQVENITNGIALPYYDENNKIVATRYRFANKIFRWKKGSKLNLYGMQNIGSIKEKGYVILVEGESDTQSLWYYNIPVLGVPGATTFKAEWIKNININIYIHHEGDFGADNFEEKIISELKKCDFKGKLYRIQCQKIGCKDPSEVNIKFDNFLEKWKIIMDAAEEIDYSQKELLSEIIEGCGVYMECPKNWKIDLSGIYRTDSRTGMLICFCATPILINRALQSLNSLEEKIELKYFIRGKWRALICERNVMLNDYNSMKLVDYGISISKSNAKYLTQFLWELEMINKEKINCSKYTNQMGWYGKLFLPVDRDKITIDESLGTTRWVNAFESRGTLKEWTNSIKIYRNNDIFRFILSSSFAAPILHFANSRTIVIHNWAGSRSGKTACLKAALSIWGNPDALATSFNTTRTGIERMAAFFKDLPIGIDEKQVSGKGQEFIDGLIYMIGLGSTKLRGNKNRWTPRTIELAKSCINHRRGTYNNNDIAYRNIK